MTQCAENHGHKHNIRGEEKKGRYIQDEKPQSDQLFWKYKEALRDRTGRASVDIFDKTATLLSRHSVEVKHA